MNISEFHRTRPVKTYASIKDLEDYVEAVIANLKCNNTYNSDLYIIKDKLKLVKENFIKGE